MVTAVKKSDPKGYAYLEFTTKNTSICTDHLIPVTKARDRRVRKMRRSEDRNKYWHEQLLEKVQSENQGSGVNNKIGS
jgi:hypothetical protein